MENLKFALALALPALFAATAARAQAPRSFDFHAVNYNVQATLHPSDQSLSGEARVRFVADAASRTLAVELHPDLRVTSVRDAAGKPLSFARDPNLPLRLLVDLPEAIAVGKELTATFQYAGPISNDEDSPTKGVRFVWVDKTSAFLLLPGRWFPLTKYPSNRYTATFKLAVPDSFAVVGTGTPSAPNILPAGKAGEGGQAVYTFVCDKPAPVGTFVAGNLRLSPQQIEGVSFSVYTLPSGSATATPYATAVAHELAFFSAEFGALENPQLTIAQLPDGSLPAYSAPGLLLVSAREWAQKPNETLLSQLTAAEWWSSAVLPASSADVWLSDGLARFSAVLYLDQNEGLAGVNKVLQDFAVGALTYEEVAAISQADHLEAYSDQYRSVVQDKGALVFNMLRSQLGDAAFKGLLQDYYKQYAGRNASLADFEKLAAAKAPAPSAGQTAVNLTAFFSQWLNSTGIPEFKLDYVVLRTPQGKGFKVVGKITQELETFRMPVELRVDTEGNPEKAVVNVVGTSTAFEIESFGRPKPYGVIIDPDNHILKSNPKLRVRAVIARGEALAGEAKFYEAIQEYQRALEVQSNNSLAHFRMGEAFFYQKNYQAAANAFRSALDGDLDASYKWVEVWSHIYLGKIFDVTGSRDRAVNEYSKAQHIGDDTGGAQAEAARYISKPYTEQTANAPAAK